MEYGNRSVLLVNLVVAGLLERIDPDLIFGGHYEAALDDLDVFANQIGNLEGLKQELFLFWINNRCFCPKDGKNEMIVSRHIIFLTRLDVDFTNSTFYEQLLN